MDNEIQKKESGALEIPSTRRGHEEKVQREDLMIPRSLMIQFTPPKSSDYDPEKHKPGMLVNSITMEQLPSDATKSVLFVPIKRSVEWVRFNPQDESNPDFDSEFEPGAVIWKSSDPEDKRVIEEGAWGEDGKAPIATKFINYLSYVPGHDMPIVISFAKTSFKAGKKLTTMTQIAPGDLFSWSYRLRPKMEQNAKSQKYYVLTVEAAGKTSAENYAQAEAYYNMFAGVTLNIHDVNANEEEEESASGKKAEKPWDK